MLALKEQLNKYTLKYHIRSLLSPNQQYNLPHITPILQQIIGTVYYQLRAGTCLSGVKNYIPKTKHGFEFHKPPHQPTFE